MRDVDPDLDPDRRPARRALIAGAVVLGLAAVGVVVWRSHASGGRPRTTTVAIDRGPITAKVTATGTLSALVTVQVGTPVSGHIKSLAVDFNSVVKQGDVLAQIDPELFAATLEQARANLAAAQGDLAAAEARAADGERQAKRGQELASRGLLSSAELETGHANADVATAQVSAARGKVAQARAAVHQAEINLGYTTIVSPIDGVVIARNVDVGQTVAAALSAPTLFVIARDLHAMMVDTSVAEADIGKLTAGMTADLTFDAYPGEKFHGKVRQVRNAPQTVQNVVTYDAVIDIENPGLKLKPGMTANVTFVYASRDDVVRVPNAALRFRPPREWSPDGRPPKPTDGQRAVWVVRAGQPTMVTITPGVSDGSKTEVVHGELREGDLVVTDVGAAPAPASVAPASRRMF